MDNNLKLYLPFDDPEGDTAYDHSVTRHDGTLSGGARFSKDAVFGKSLDMNRGDCTTDTTIPFSSNFTISLWAKLKGNKMGWILNFSGIENYLEQWLDVAPGSWIFLAFVRDGNKFYVYMDNVEVYQHSISGNPVGFSINEWGLVESDCLLDDIRIFNVAKNVVELFKLAAHTDVDYFINGENFKDLSVFVSGSTGLVGKLGKKDGLSVDWDNYHGKVVDRSRPRYKERTITLDCFIEAKSRTDFVDKVNLFLSKFTAAGTQRLKVEFDGTAKPLVYEVACDDSIDPTKQWGSYNVELMVGTFKLKLEEDEPVKKVLRHIGTANSTATITLTSNKLLNIYWGDGTHSYNISGTSQSLSHTYAAAGEYEIVITGVIEDITNFSTNAIVIWDKLQ